MKIFMKKRLVLALGLLLAGVAAAWLHSKKEQPLPESKYRAVAVDTGNITQTVTATGTINPVALINVGSQVSGTVVELKADFNDHVKKGQVLLKLDPTIFNAQIRQVEAASPRPRRRCGWPRPTSSATNAWSARITCRP
jgi:HlyD family secretion protein